MKNKEKYFYCYNLRLENYLTLNGIYPIGYEGENAVYENTQKLNKLLDTYWIKVNIFKEI